MTVLGLFQQQRQQQHQQQEPSKRKQKRPKRFVAVINNSSRKAVLRTPQTTKPIQKATKYQSTTYPYQICQLLLIVVSLLLFILPTNADWLMECGSCHCKWNSGKKTADCKNLSLSAIPENLSPDVQVLDLSYNHIEYLEPNAFLNAQLHNLHKLYIRNASMLKINPHSFTQLEILIELDLSNNQLHVLQINQFAHLVKVRALLLNSNLLETLGDGIFQNLNYLHRLELKSNRLTRISTKVFVNLPILSQIYLDENRLSFLRKESFEHLKRLTALSLDQNPWNCSCELQIFRDFVLQRNLYTPPTACYFPAHLRGMLWIEDQPEAFACKPKIIYPTKGASINTSKENVTLICRVHASPNTHITWNHNKQLIRSNTLAFDGSQRFHIQLLRDENAKEKGVGQNMFISRLTIVGAEKNDEGIYTCLAENAGGKDSVQMNLLVQNSTTKEFWFLQGNLVIVIALMALGLLSLSFFVTMVTCCIYKRFKLFNGLTPHHHHQHHGHHNHHHHLDTQLTTTASNGIVESTAINAGEACGSGSNSTGIITINENGKTTSVGNYHYLVKENTNMNSNKTAKKYTNCLLREDSSYIVSNTNTDFENKSITEPPTRQFNKDTTRFSPSYELSPSKQTWNNSNISNKNVHDSGTALRKEYHPGGDYQPDLLSAYKNSKLNS